VWPGGHEPSPVKLQPPLSSRGPLDSPPLHHHRRRAFPSPQSASAGAPVTSSARFHGQPPLGHLARSRVLPRRRLDPPELEPPFSIAGEPPPAATGHLPPPPSALCLGRKKRKVGTSSLFPCVGDKWGQWYNGSRMSVKWWQIWVRDRVGVAIKLGLVSSGF
jgi:hypothetical protein